MKAFDGVIVPARHLGFANMTGQKKKGIISLSSQLEGSIVEFEPKVSAQLLIAARLPKKILSSSWQLSTIIHLHWTYLDSFFEL